MNSTERMLKKLGRDRKERSEDRICVVCDTTFPGQKNAFTCSERCRKRRSRSGVALLSVEGSKDSVALLIDTKTWLYRAYNRAGNLLYVGITGSPRDRMIDHRRNSVWWDDKRDMTWAIYPNRREAEIAEDIAIKLECPVFNIVGRIV